MPNYVGPVGSTDAKIVIVGEAPGKDEDRMLRPFVGRAGQLLDRILASTGIPRSSCYITNVFKRKPPNNDVEYYVRIGKTSATLQNGGEAMLEDFYEEISDLKPNVIVALGNTPLWALTDNRGILKWRGSVIPSKPIHGRTFKVIPAIHPAACLRTPEWSYLLNFDIYSRVLPESRIPDIPEDPNSYVLEPSFETMLEFLEYASMAGRVGVDIEVARREVQCISFCAEKGEAISIPFWSLSRGHLMTRDQEMTIWKHIAYILEDPTIEKIFHNAAFDATFLFQKYGIATTNIHDTMVAQAILWPDFPKSLAFATSMYTNMAYYKDEGKEQMLKTGRAETGDDLIFWRYNARDALVLKEILEKQLKDLDRVDQRATYNRQRRCLEPIIFMSSIGMKVDLERLDKERDTGMQDVEELRSKLVEAAGYELNPNSPTQLKDYFYEVAKERPVLNEGKPTTNEKALKVLARRQGQGSKVASILLEYRKAHKLSSVYYGMTFDADGRLRSSINPVGTETGRFSSSQTIFGTGGNMQNMPGSFRRFLIPDPGYVMFEMDLSQAENRIVAFLANEEFMLEAFSSGADVHSLTASLLFGGPPTKEYQNSKISPLGTGTRPQRYWGKEANHALNYAMGAGTAASRWEIPVGQAREIRAKYYAAYPNIVRWQRKNEAQMRESRTMTNLYGRRRKYLGGYGGDLIHQAHAFVPQSTVADHINLYGVQEIYFNEEFSPTELLLQLHDSIYFQVPLDLGWSGIGWILTALKLSLETPIVQDDRSLTIPASITIHPLNMREGKEISDLRPDALEEVYNQLIK